MQYLKEGYYLAVVMRVIFFYGLRFQGNFFGGDRMDVILMLQNEQYIDNEGDYRIINICILVIGGYGYGVWIGQYEDLGWGNRI